MKRIYLIILFCFYSFGYGLDNHGNKYFFPDLFNSSVKDEKTAEDIMKNKSQDKELLKQAGIFYFVKSSGMPKGDKQKEKIARKAVDAFENLWKTDRKNNVYRLLLGFSYCVMGDIQGISIEEILNYVFKARNLFSMAVSSLPENIDARHARNLINMNLPSNAGRPDDMVLEDSLKYFEVYDKLDKVQKESEMYLMGLSEMHLAAAMIYETKNQLPEAKKHFQLTEKKYLTENLLKFYQELEGRLGK